MLSDACGEQWIVSARDSRAKPSGWFDRSRSAVKDASGIIKVRLRPVFCTPKDVPDQNFGQSQILPPQPSIEPPSQPWSKVREGEWRRVFDELSKNLFFSAAAVRRKRLVEPYGGVTRA